jgi:hypothetical protein
MCAGRVAVCFYSTSLCQLSPGMRSGQCLALPLREWNRGSGAAHGYRCMAVPCIVRTVTADLVDRFVYGDRAQQPSQCARVIDVLSLHQYYTHLTGLQVQSQIYLTSGAPLRIHEMARRMRGRSDLDPPRHIGRPENDLPEVTDSRKQEVKIFGGTFMGS